MASLSNAKVLGGVGGVFAIIPGISIVGWILIIIALKEASDVTQDRSIFDDGLIGGITAIISAVVLLVFFGTGTLGVIVAFYFGLTCLLVPSWTIVVFAIIGCVMYYGHISWI